jgi:hypothetical protein
MNEKMENSGPVSIIEKSANFEGNDTLLFFERLQNPKIREQMIELFLKYKNYSGDGYEYKTDENDQIIKVLIPDSKPVTRNEIEEEIEENIRKASLSTGINLDKNPKKMGGDQKELFIFSKDPETGEQFTQKQLSMIEAHEKGHSIRSFSIDSMPEIKSGFDFSKIEFTPELQNIFKNEEKEESIKEINERIFEYFTSPNEIIERMSQLKNYFGMKGEELFTKEHLDYIKKHYMKDTGFTLQIKPFLDSITKETEIRFLELINSLGI